MYHLINNGVQLAVVSFMLIEPLVKFALADQYFSFYAIMRNRVVRIMQVVPESAHRKA
jgi:hypothetical protein